MHSPSQCVEFHLSVMDVRVGGGDGVGEVISVESVIVMKSSIQVGVHCEGVEQVCVCVWGGGGGGRGIVTGYSHPGKPERTPTTS